MANRHNHYEAAFEAYLRDRRVAYVAVNEQRRSRLGGGTLKSVDFLVSPANGATLLVDVKGRRFPSGTRQKQYWRNWSTWDDLRSLARWQDQFGGQSLGLLAFVYDVVGERSPLPWERLFRHRDRLYAMLAVRTLDYIRFLKPISPKWQTVALSAAQFREAAFPLDDLLHPAPTRPAATPRTPLTSDRLAASGGNAIDDAPDPLDLATELPNSCGHSAATVGTPSGGD